MSAQDVAPTSDDNAAVAEDVETQILPVLQLRPTQLAVGYHAARDKAARIAAKKPTKQAKYFRTHPVPVVVAPDGGKYIIDHHHLCFAALLLGVADVHVTVRADWSDSATTDDFWRRMHDASYVWLNDPEGKPIALEDFPKLLPKDVSGLRDDPYRSLAAAVRRAGGYDKVWTPFSEFHWANFYRPLIPIADTSVTDEHIQKALQLSRSMLAAGLPGHIPDGSDTAAAVRAVPAAPPVGT